MLRILLCVCLVVVAFSSAQADDYVVIVAGSNTYGNYRHQADACRAYQVAIEGGIPASNIITFMYDDIAQNRENPFPGSIYNAPARGTNQGIDVYEGVALDYTGSDVTPDNFIAVITGDAAAMSNIGTGRVLTSTSQDNVFINFVDHGGPGIICFPEANLAANDLIAALTTMQTNKMYSKLAFYLEACESGSMFANGLLPDDMHIYATTAADPDESSWGTFCPPDDVVNGKEMNTCLGDLYSVTWMSNLQKFGTDQTLDTEFQYIVSHTNLSHPQQYGDTSWTSDLVSEFLGNIKPSDEDVAAAKAHSERAWTSAVRRPDIPMHLQYYKYLRAEKTTNTEMEARLALAQELQETLSKNIETDLFFMNLAKLSAARSNMVHDAAMDMVLFNKLDANVIQETNACAENLREMYITACHDGERFDEYSMQYWRSFNNLCHMHQESIAQDFISTNCN